MHGRQRRSAGPLSAVRLGDTLSELVEAEIEPQQRRVESVAALWSRLLPAELNRHCRIAGISGGCLRVVADSPSYMYELQLCSSTVLKELQRACPKARLEKIKLALG